MFGVLLESRARRQRRTGGAALSVATHLAIIGTVTAMTVPTPIHKPQQPEQVNVVIAPEPQPTHSESQHAPAGAARVGIFTRKMNILIPTPSIDSKVNLNDLIPWPDANAPIEIGGSPNGDPRSRIGRIDLTEPAQDSTWNGSEALMRVIAQAKPHYPESLRQAAIDGRVLVQFKVDTLGKIDPASVTILATTHDLFSRSVRDALGGFRFRPAEVNGRKVVALAQMPFEFSIRR